MFQLRGSKSHELRPNRSGAGRLERCILVTGKCCCSHEAAIEIRALFITLSWFMPSEINHLAVIKHSSVTEDFVLNVRHRFGGGEVRTLADLSGRAPDGGGGGGELP